MLKRMEDGKVDGKSCDWELSMLKGWAAACGVSTPQFIMCG